MESSSPQDALLVTIDGLSSLGHGVALVDAGGSKRRIFVPGAVPGDRVEIAMTDPRGPHGNQASILRVVSASSERTIPSCPYVGRCGGCSVQHVSYPCQLREKEALVKRAFAGFGEEVYSKVRPIIAARQPLGTRTRGRFHVSVEGSSGTAVRKFGLHTTGTNDVVDIETCPALDARLDDAMRWIRRFWLDELPDKAQVELVLDEGKERVVAVAYPPMDGGSPAASPKGGSLVMTDIEVPEESPPAGLSLQTGSCLEGASYFPIEGDRPLRFMPGVFTQSDIVQNRVLVKEVVKAAQAGSDDRVLDLCCGVGNFSLPLSRCARLVEGIEGNRRAVEVASQNAIRWKMQNVRFFKGDVSRALWGLRSKRKRFEVVVVDPPRTGIGPAIAALDEVALGRIVYVSCDPHACAKDIASLKTFDVVSIQPIDMFPQTMHVETVVVLEKRRPAVQPPAEPDSSKKIELRMSDL